VGTWDKMCCVRLFIRSSIPYSFISLLPFISHIKHTSMHARSGYSRSVMRRSNLAHLHKHAISLFKRHAINQPTRHLTTLITTLQRSPWSLQTPSKNPHNNLRSVSSPRSPHPLQSPHYNCLNHSQRFNTFTTNASASSTSQQPLQTASTTVSSLDAHHSL